MPLSILFFTDNFPPEVNAAASRVYERALHWVRWGHRVSVITSAPNFPEGRLHEGYENRWHQVEEIDGIRVVRVKTFIAPNTGVARRALDFGSYMITSFLAAFSEGTPDIVVSTSPQMLAAVAAVGAARVKRVPHVLELGDLWPASIAELGALNFGLRVLEQLELGLYARSRAIVALTRAFKDNLVARGVPSEKIAVVRNGAELDQWKPSEKDLTLASKLGLSGKRVVGYIGTQGMAHSLDNVLSAANLLKDREDIRFMFVGSGAAGPRLIAETKRLALPNVIFVPPQPKSMISSYWNLSDAALVHLKDIPVMRTVIPSKSFEAMCFGLPLLVVAPRGEITRIVEETGAGVIVEPSNPPALAAAVQRLFDQPGVLASLAQASAASARQFSREIQARKMIAVLEAVVRGESVPPEER